MSLGDVGVWCGGLRFRLHDDPGAVAAAAAELEELGYGALFVPGGPSADVLPAARHVLDSTRAVPVVTGIVNIWVHAPKDVAAAHARIDAAHPGRFVLGLGVSHAASVAELGAGTYARPLATMDAYLDRLEALAPDLGPGTRLLAALGPRMLVLAARRTAGAHPYFVPVEHTRLARAQMGPGALLAPELAVCLETDPDRARALARAHMAIHLGQPNYARNLLRCGFTEDDLRDGGSDRLVDALVAWGGEEAVAARVAAHRAAGADHVCIQVVDVDWEQLPLEHWRRLAPALTA